MAGPRRTGLKQLAAALGLSITTVSRALADYPDVSPATRDRVRAAADRMGYVPSRVARTLVSGRSDVIGMVLPMRDGHVIDAFLGTFITGLGEGLAERGRDLFLATVTRRQTEVEVLKHIIDGHRADALVINRTEVADRRVAYLLDRGFPFVVHGRLLDESRPYVHFDTDGEGAFRRAAEMLVALGHRRFGLLTIAEPYSFARLRRRGLERALAVAGLALPPSAIVAAPMSDPQAARAAAARLLALDPRPTAVLCAVDSLALALLEAAKAQGVAVPDDMSVIGFDDVPIAAFADPPLSTFDQAARESAATVAGMVIDVLERGPGQVESRCIEPGFIARASHGPAPRPRRVSAA